MMSKGSLEQGGGLAYRKNERGVAWLSIEVSEGSTVPELERACKE